LIDMLSLFQWMRKYALNAIIENISLNLDEN